MGTISARSGKTIEERLIYYSRAHRSGCRLWVGHLDRLGYGRIQYQLRHQRAHRVAWEVVNGPIPKGMKVCHSCDTRHCVNIDHLFLGTQVDNMADMTRKGRRWITFTREQFEAVRKARGKLVTIARKTGVGLGSVQKIKRGWVPHMYR